MQWLILWDKKFLSALQTNTTSYKGEVLSIFKVIKSLSCSVEESIINFEAAFKFPVKSPSIFLGLSLIPQV